MPSETRNAIKSCIRQHSKPLNYEARRHSYGGLSCVIRILFTLMINKTDNVDHNDSETGDCNVLLQPTVNSSTG